MIPASQAISYYRGDTLRFYVRPQDQDGNEVDLTDYTSSFIIASDRTGTPTTLIEASTTKLGNIIECTLDSDDGELLDSSVTYQYDVTIASADDPPVVYTYLTGTITVIDDVNGAVIPADGLGWLGDFTVTNGNLIVDRSADTTFPQIQIKAPSSSYEASLRFYDSSTLKWRIHKAATTVDLTFSSSVVGAALTLSHTTGDATFSSDVTVGGDLATANFEQTAGNNLWVGSDEPDSVTSGVNLVGIGGGGDTMDAVTTGTSSIAIGGAALGAWSTGTGMIAIGVQAMQYSTGGTYSVGIGLNALRNMTNSENVGIGWGAGDTVTTGGYSVYVGANADTSVAGASHQTLIGRNATSASSYSVALGSGTSVTGSGGVAIGMDSGGASATAGSNQIALGTANHTVSIPGDLDVGGNLEVNGSYLTLHSAGHAYLNADAALGGYASGVRFQENGSTFWFAEKLTSGSSRNFRIQNDSSQGMTLAYSGGAATFTSDVTVGGNLAIDRVGDAAQASAIVDSDTGNDSRLELRSAGSARWRIGRTATTHQFHLWSSSLGANAVTVDHSTGSATFAAAVTVGGRINGQNITGTTSTGIGPNVSAAGGYSVAIGNGANTSANNAIAIGRGVTASHTGSVAIGRSAADTPAATTTTDEIVLGTSAHTVNAPGNVTVGGDIELGSGGPTITTGTAVPSASEPQGSKYIRTTSLGDHEYVSLGGGTWQPTGACDTGVRDLSGETLSNSWALNGGYFFLRRVGNTVTLNARFDGTSASNAFIYALPAGFRPTTWTGFLVPYGTSGTGKYMQVDGSGNMYIQYYGAGIHYVTISWPAAVGAWPTSLPGT